MGILLKPIITEKMTKNGESYNRYGFLVDTSSNKIEIKKEVERIYGVSVTAVRTMIYRPDRKVKYTKSGVQYGKTNKLKKAIVQLVDGDTIDIYGNIG